MNPSSFPQIPLRVNEGVLFSIRREKTNGKTSYLILSQASTGYYYYHLHRLRFLDLLSLQAFNKLLSVAPNQPSKHEKQVYIYTFWSTKGLKIKISHLLSIVSFKRHDVKSGRPSYSTALYFWIINLVISFSFVRQLVNLFRKGSSKRKRND
jgi:hypothetical protein